MQKHWPIILTAGVIVAAVAAIAVAAPKPATVPPPGTWQIDLELHGAPQPIEITLPGDTLPRRYWYLTYTVINNTGKDIDFYPQFDLFTDTFKLYRADVKPRDDLFEAIRQRYKTTIPLLEPPSNLTGPLLQGKDNARDSVAIFEDFDPNAHYIRIFISGLSNETVLADIPAPPAEFQKQKIKQVLLRKTLMLEYQAPGDRINLENRVMLYRNREWIMR
jgi:hypothetical protein